MKTEGRIERKKKDKERRLIADSVFHHGRPDAIYHQINSQLKPIHQLYSSITLHVPLLSVFNQHPSIIYHSSLPLAINPSVF